MDNLEEMDRFLEKFNLSRLNQEEIEIMNNPITSTKIEAVIKKIFQKTKAQDHMTSQENSIKHLRRADAYPSKIISKNCRVGTLPNLFYEATITLDTKTRQHKKRKLEGNITDERRCKNPQQNFSNNSAIHQKVHTP